MYVKIVIRHSEDEQEVSSRPTKHHLFEAKEVEYQKVTVDGIKHFQEKMDELGTVRVVTEIPNTDAIFEYLQIEMDKLMTLIARNCTLFLMNREGKTIDSIVC